MSVLTKRVEVAGGSGGNKKDKDEAASSFAGVVPVAEQASKVDAQLRRRR